MSETTGRPVAGAAAVCLDGDRVLLVQRGREPNQGCWSFPGGKIEPGETARATAERETREETGLSVRILDVVDVYDALFPPYHYCVADYLAECLDPSVEPAPGDDVTDARWVPFMELEIYELSAAMEQVLARARWLRRARRGAPPPLGMAPLSEEDRTPGCFRDRITGIYAITDATLFPGRGHVEVARAALAAGVRVVQLRDKERDAGELLPLIWEIRRLCRAAGALFLVNDRVDLAQAADGVHLGQTDFPVALARAMLGPERCVGISVENEEQVRAAEEAGADYLGVGAIYGTSTKLDAGDPVGLEQLRRFRAITALPLVAIGGITRERLPEVRRAGADSAAVIGAIAAQPEPETAARELVRTWEAAR